MASGAMFAPNYIENKLKFFRTSRRRSPSATSRDMVCAFVNIDMGSVGNWAERRALPYSGYTDLAGKPEVYELIRECVEQVNAELAAEGDLAASQIHRFLILHKELDPDDDELDAHAQGAARLRRREVQRADRRAVLRDSTVQHIETAVKFEDGRSGMVAADLAIAEAKTFAAHCRARGGARDERRAARDADRRRHPEARHTSRSRSAVCKALTDISLRRPRARGARDHRPQRRGQELDAERDQRRLPSAAGNDHLPRQGAARHGHARRRGAGHRAHVPEHRAVPRHDGARQHHDRPQPQDEGDVSRAGDLVGPRAARGARAPAQGRGGDRVPRDPAHPQDAGRAAALRTAEARRARPRARRRAARCCCWTSRWRG